MARTTPKKQKVEEGIIHQLIFHERRSLLIVCAAIVIIAAAVFFTRQHYRKVPGALTTQETAAQRFIDNAPVIHGMSGTVTAINNEKGELLFRVHFPFDTYAPERTAIIMPETTFGKTHFVLDRETNRTRAEHEDVVFADIAVGDDIIVSSLANVKEARRFNAEHIQILTRPEKPDL